MFKALLASIGLLIVAILAVKGELSFYGLVYKTWFVVLFSWILGGILDTAFLSFYAEAIKKLSSNGAN